MSAPRQPSWPHCGHGADPHSDPVGCRGIHVPGSTACLAHLADADRDAYLAGLTPGADIDHRGTPFSEQLLNALLDALRDPTTHTAHIQNAWFGEAQFSDHARFEEAQFSGFAGFSAALFSGGAVFVGARFSGVTVFSGAQFSSYARFEGAQFPNWAWFDEAQFSSDARFSGAQFSSNTRFVGAQFSGLARFDEAQFSGDVRFVGAQFSGGAWFSGAQFFGDARFEGAQFPSDAWFGKAQFSGRAWFSEAVFSGDARFIGAQFSGDVWLSGAVFSGLASFLEAQFSALAGFEGAQFPDLASFEGAKFSDVALFEGVQFSGFVTFEKAQFSGPARFGGALFSSDARFEGARFEAVSVLGPLVCAGGVHLCRAVFALPVTVEAAAREMLCERTRWESTATIRLRYAAVDLSHAVLSGPVAVIAHAIPFTTTAGPVREDLMTGPDTVRVTSVQGVDAAHLVLTDTDLTDCLFSGAFHLDQISLEGRTTFASAPTGWHRHGIRPVHWTRRRTLAEEHHWRAQTTGQPTPPPDHAPSLSRWRPGPHHPDPAHTPDPVDVAALYRQLRKAFEDGKNEPGAADFYYSECEMRRHDRTPDTSKAERRLLWGYWLLSGYGLRASRAAGWLLAAMSLTVLLLMGFGLPTHDPDPATTGSLHGSKISLNTTTPDPALHGGWTKRISWKRAEKATRVAVNSVVFRSSGQNLTTAGTYIEMTSRLLEPTLLALAALAVRGRIKR